MELYFIDSQGIEHTVQRDGYCATKQVRLILATWRVQVLDAQGRIEGEFPVEIRRVNTHGNTRGRRLSR